MKREFGDKRKKLGSRDRVRTTQKVRVDAEVIWTAFGNRPNIYGVDVWTVITILGLSSPFIWLWGMHKYLQDGPHSDWRSRASLVGLFSPVLSLFLWAVTVLLAWEKGWHTSTPTVERMITVGGIWIPILGMLVGLAGQPRLILAIIPVSVGTVLFWYSTTLP
jgi:hypothetical protein